MKPTLGRSLLAGFAGTVVMTVMMYTVAPMMGLNMDIAQMLGSVLGGSWALGMLMHFVNGTVIFPLLYALILVRWLPGGPIAQGIVWGLLLWLVAQTMVMPMMGAGFFSLRMGTMAPIGSLVGHVLYGGTLGALAHTPAPRHAPTMS